VDAGSLKLADEKRALQEINQTKRIRKTVESFQAESDAIDADRAAVEELKKQLDDPEAKAISERYDAIKAELDEIKKEEDKLYTNRSQLFEERNTLQQQVDTLFMERRESTAQFREANDRYYAKLNEDRARRAERRRAQKEAEEEEKRQARAIRLREEASQPAFQVQVEDCQTLIDYFSGKSSTAVVSSAKAGFAEPSQEIRQVEAAPDSFVLRKKKGEEEEAYFVGGKGKSKSKKGNKADANAPPVEATPSSSTVNVPFGTLSALLSLSIPPPSSQADVPRVVEDLKTKKAWFEANQARVTAEAIAKAEAEIQRLTKGKGDGGALLDDWPTNKGSAEAQGTDERLSDAETGQPEEVEGTVTKAS
jgi:DNA repair exonuclease SbcCD ATPase subunit